jgi:hypothetical protein
LGELTSKYFGHSDSFLTAFRHFISKTFYATLAGNTCQIENSCLSILAVVYKIWRFFYA